MSESDLSPEDREDLVRCFGYHPPSGDAKDRFERITAAVQDAAVVVFLVCPPGAERDAAVLALRNARMWANASIACAPTNKGR